MNQKVEELRALMWAEIHMREALSASEHLASLDPQKIPLQLSHCILAGIVVSYGRSFGRNNCLAPIDERFSTFESEDHQKLHKYLKLTRDQTYAHMDITRKRNEFTTPVSDENLHSIGIEIGETGKCSWYVKLEGTPAHVVPMIAELCSFQLKRIHEEGVKKIHELIEGKMCTPGLFTLGLDWPPE